MRNDIDPCRFCKSTACIVGLDDRTDKVSVRCGYCFARGPAKDDADDAVAAWNTRAELSSLRGEGEACQKCDDSGYIELASGGIWTGENITTRREYCDCACGQDARDQADGVGMHAAHPTPDSDVIGRLVGVLREIEHAESKEIAKHLARQALASIPTPDGKP